MADTPAPTSPPTTRELVDQLRQTYHDRQTALSEIRGAGQDAALFELIGFRGMTADEAGEHLGVSGQAIRKRVGPMLRADGLDHLSWAERQSADVVRPHRDLSNSALLDVLLGSDRRNAERARDLLVEMVRLVEELNAGGMTYETIAELLGVTPITIHRARQRAAAR